MRLLKLIVWAAVFASCACGLSQVCGHNKKSSGQIRVVQDPEERSAKRLTVPPKPHSLRMQARYLRPVSSSKRTFEVIKTTFSIARFYYFKVLKVTYLPQDKTKYPAGANTNIPCDSIMPQSYIQSGFDQNSNDMVVFIDAVNQKKDAYVASAQGCLLRRRPLYGYIVYNVAFLPDGMLAEMHLAIQITIHELAHLLGFSEEYYSEFYMGPLSNEKRPQSEVFVKQNGRAMIVSPKVKAYVQEYFGCYDGVTGALLEDEGGSGTRNNHWEKLIFRDQLMSPMLLLSGVKITGLTLALLADTNFYQDVDRSFAEPVRWGARKGCDFAQGRVHAFANTCSSPCDYYGQYGAECSKDFFTNEVPMDQIRNNLLCEKESSIMPSFSNYYSRPGDRSRCFGTDRGASCYTATCDSPNGPVTVTVNNITFKCLTPNTWFRVSDVIMNCPKDFSVFCSRRSCPRWCSGRGLCINGACLCHPPFYGPDCSLTFRVQP